MSDLLPIFDGDDGDDSRHHRDSARDRSRSLATLAVVLIFAVAVVGLAVLALRSPHKNHSSDNNQLAGPTQAVTIGAPSTSDTPTDIATTSAASSASTSPSTSASKSTSTSASASTSSAKTTHAHASSTPTVSTISTGSCAGCSASEADAIEAFNAYRHTKGLSSVHGRGTNAARSCSDSLQAPGGTLYCRAPYADAVESSQNGQQAVSDALANHTGGWFTDAMTSVEVGSSSDGAGHYYYAFFEN